MASRKFSQKKVEEYRKLFAKVDGDKGGKISVPELMSAMRNLGHSVTRQEVEAIIDSVDKDGSKTMDLSEFITWMERKAANAAESREALEDFKRYDINKDGFITADELREVMRVRGEKLCNAEVDKMMNQLDINDDGKVNYLEFAKMMML